MIDYVEKAFEPDRSTAGLAGHPSRCAAGFQRDPSRHAASTPFVERNLFRCQRLALSASTSPMNEPIPHGIEVLVLKAAVDPDFKELLLQRRTAAAEAIGLELTAAEARCWPLCQTRSLRQSLPDLRAAGAPPVFLGRPRRPCWRHWASTAKPAMAFQGIGPDLPPPTQPKAVTRWRVIEVISKRTASRHNESSEATRCQRLGRSRHVVAAQGP